MEFKNYISIKKASLRYQYFCFIDTNEYLADRLFINHKVRVHFQNEAYRPDIDYVFIFCKVKKRDVSEFLEALEELKNKMILLGHSDYETFCIEAQNNILGQKEKAC